MPNYAICTMKKFNSSKITKLEKHNERKNKSYSNQEIDKSKSYLNFSLVEDHQPLRERIDDEINEHYSNTRKIRKDAILLNGFIIGASQDFMEQLSKDEQKEYFKTAKKYFDKNYGHVVSANVHLDETNPHMHLGVVPLVEIPEKEYTTLSSKKLFDRNELRTIQSEFPKHMQKHGFDVKRGEKEGKKKYIKNIEDYKKKNHKIISEYLSKIKPDKFVNEIRNKPKTFFKNNVKYTEEEHKKMLKSIKNLNRIIAEKEQLEKDFKGLLDETKALAKDKVSLKKDIQEYQKIVKSLKKDFRIEKKNLKNDFESEKQDLKKDIKKLKDTVKVYQNYFKEFDIKLKIVDHVQKATTSQSFADAVEKKIINKYLNNFNEQLVGDPSLNQDDFLQITVDDVKKEAKELNKYFINKFNKVDITKKDKRITYHYIRKNLFRVLKEHPRVEMYDGYYQILSDNDLKIKEKEKQIRKQKQKEYQEFKTMMNDKASYNSTFLKKLDRYLYNLDYDDLKDNYKKSCDKVWKAMESTNQDDITIFTKKDREFYSKVIGREVAFKDLYKFKGKSFKKAVVNTTFNLAFNPKKRNNVKKAISRYKNLLKQNKEEEKQRIARERGLSL
ncbi:MAG: MobV family relaxase [Bacillota bacterium]